ncbi:MAG TPA: LLM class F420-dependent oxidoreductase, partial [Lapillicoccus sp.]|nr:LLM class F420-dependent oxidoreductase [Lapillicoccus sp.]
VSMPHPRILVGGGGERKTLRLVAQYADACNIFDMGPDAVRAKYDVIRRHCEAVGRDYDDIEKTVLSRVDFAKESDDSIVDRVGRLRDVGTQHVIFGVARVWAPGSLDRVPGLVAQLD